MKIHKDDNVIVISGKDKGKTGKVLKVYTNKDKVLVEGVGLVKKHIKPGVANAEGGIVTMETPISVSNVMYYDEKAKEAVKVGYKIIKGKKYRVSKKTGDVLGA